MKKSARGIEVREFILTNVESHPADIAKLTATRFNISRQAVNKHLRILITAKDLTRSGSTRNKTYKLTRTKTIEHRYPISSDLAEDVVWRNDIKPALSDAPENVLNIWQYGFTEMFNNAIDHSAGTAIIVSISKTPTSTEILITDDGVGIFKKIQSAFNLLDERHAILELAKGKLTTDPKHHSGEGIFFSSRVFDSFGILAGGVYFTHRFGQPEDWIIASDEFAKGTTIRMKLHNQITRTLTKIMNQYASGDEDYGFNKTVVPVILAQYGDDKLISRSQAKRVLARIELFKNVIFDFKDVDSIGQAFADEIFRVFATQHPDIELIVRHANSKIKQMVERAKSVKIGRLD